MGSCVHVEGGVQDEGREVGEDKAMQCPGAMLGLWSALNRRFMILGLIFKSFIHFQGPKTLAC